MNFSVLLAAAGGKNLQAISWIKKFEL